MYFVFFFKQKTAYEMRISDWSSDVCSSDLDDRRHVAIFERAVDRRFQRRLFGHLRRAADVEGPHRKLRARLTDRLGRDHADRFAHVHRRTAREITPITGGAHARLGFADQRTADLDDRRSEEHTYELQ